jgi:hypothetical protein
MNYHPTSDYPINLENVFKMIGFANKGNAMKTIQSNFTEGEDYKKLLFRMEKQVKNGKDLTCNTRKHKWNLIFDKKVFNDKEVFYVKQEALDYYNLIK